MEHQTGLLVAVGAAVLGIIFAGMRRPARFDPAAGTLTLAHHPLIRIVAFLGYAMCAFMIVLAVTVPFKQPNEPAIALGMIVACGAMATLLLQESRSRVVLSAEGITRWSAWRGEKTIRWDAVRAVSYSAVAQTVTILAEDGRKV